MLQYSYICISDLLAPRSDNVHSSVLCVQSMNKLENLLLPDENCLNDHSPQISVFIIIQINAHINSIKLILKFLRHVSPYLHHSQGD
jgi:hypothetical protein